MEFEELVKALIKDGYDVEVEDVTTEAIPFYFAKVTGKGIFARFCTQNADFYPYLNERIAADNAECFDKWSKCPLVMKIPVNYDELKKHLKHLGSKEGYEISNSYAYLDNNPYPYEGPE